MIGKALRLVFYAFVVGVVVLDAAAALAQGSNGALTGPQLSVNRSEAAPGDTVNLAFVGWHARHVDIAVCGNLAKRGSADCNMAGALGNTMVDGERQTTDFLVSAPPVPCPCVIRAWSNATDESAVAPIVITGQPVAPVVDPNAGKAPLDVTIEAEAAPAGFFSALRSALGGPTEYVVTVKVHNPSTDSFQKVTVAGSAGRSSTRDVASFDLQPTPLASGQTWEATTHATLPAPVLGSYVWHATASGGGPAATAASTTHRTPVLLLFLVSVLLVDLGMIVYRFFLRDRLARRKAGPDDDDGGDTDRPPPDPPPGWAAEEAEVRLGRPGAPVGASP